MFGRDLVQRLLLFWACLVWSHICLLLGVEAFARLQNSAEQPVLLAWSKVPNIRMASKSLKDSQTKHSRRHALGLEQDILLLTCRSDKNFAFVQKGIRL